MAIKEERGSAITNYNKEQRKKKWESNREYWKGDKVYLSRQAERKAKIDSYVPGPKFAKKAENEDRQRVEKEETKKRRIFERRARRAIR